MCRATTDPGGPRRCSGDTRAAYAASAHSVAVLEHEQAVLKSALADLAVPAPVPAVVSFADKETRVEDIRREIDTAIAGLGTSERWSRWLDFAGSFHSYSLANQLLIQIQCPGATLVAGFKRWKELDRSIVAGSKAIWIRAPKKKRIVPGEASEQVDVGGESGEKKTSESVVVGFMAVPVYDVGQTAGKPVPQKPVVIYTREEGTAPPQMGPLLEEQIVGHGYSVEYRELPDSGPEGFTDHASKSVVVSTRFSDAHQKMVLAHELAHIELGHMEQIHDYHSGPNGQRPTMEVEAESVAYVIGRHFGLTPGGSAFSYIDGWAKGDVKKVQSTADRVVKGCHAILGRLPASSTT